MLIEKLNHLVFKERYVREPGSGINAYQLASKTANISDIYNQCAWIFYIAVPDTSKIDPNTGFAALFDLAEVTNTAKRKNFFCSFDSIRIDVAEHCFVFSVDYRKFKRRSNLSLKLASIQPREATHVSQAK